MCPPPAVAAIPPPLLPVLPTEGPNPGREGWRVDKGTVFLPHTHLRVRALSERSRDSGGRVSARGPGEWQPESLGRRWLPEVVERVLPGCRVEMEP